MSTSTNPNTLKERLIDEQPDGDYSFSLTQATAFVEKWEVIDQYTAPQALGLTGIGFSATVFRNLDTGQYVFAARGTEPSLMNDLLVADISEIGFQGIALRQAIDLYNYRKSLDVPAGEAYQAAYLQTEVALTAALVAARTTPGYQIFVAGLQSQGYWIVDGMVKKLVLGDSTEVLAGTGLETGRGLPLDPGYDVVGHSLGGHLAMALGRLDGANVASVETFNPPYFDNFTSAGLSNAFFSQLQQLEIAAHGSSGISDSFKESQSYDAPSDLIHLIGSTRPGSSTPVFSEGDGKEPLSAHLITHITDALAVGDEGVCLPSNEANYRRAA
jgi:hypothetical protein